MQVTKWAHEAPLAEGPCGTCGQSVLYNLRVGYVAHAEQAVDPCDEPWPYEPRPKALFAHAEKTRADMERALRALESVSIFPAPQNLPAAGYVTEDPPEALTGADRREAFVAAGRIAAGGVTT